MKYQRQVIYLSRPLDDFEENIASRFWKGGYRLASPKAEWIKFYLLKYGKGYPYDMWKKWREFASMIGVRAGSYIAFVRYMFILKRLGLIKEVEEEPTHRGFPRKYYVLVEEMIDSEIWRRPVATLYPSSEKERVLF